MRNRRTQVLKFLASLHSVLIIPFKLHVSLNNLKLSPLMKSRVTMGAVFMGAAVTQYSVLISVISRYHKMTVKSYNVNS